MKPYNITPREGYWITSYLIKYMIGREGCFEATLDLGLTRRTVCLENRTMVLDNRELRLDEITPSREDRVVYVGVNEIYEVVKSDQGGFYKLKALDMDKSPTLEINGVHMHRIVGIDPWSDAKCKVLKTGVRRGDRVLDTCLGLGYTAINSLLRGALEIIGFEIDWNVLWVSEHNPWSHRLADPRILIYNMDVLKGMEMIEDNYFDKIIHDPPRYSGSTGDLYSLDFYNELYRVLKSGGKLYHYTGEPGKHGSHDIVKGIGERLRKAGFHPVYFDSKCLGYIGYKNV